MTPSHPSAAAQLHDDRFQLRRGRRARVEALPRFEPGEQAGGGAWEGQDADLKWAADAKAAGLAGTFVWAINPDAGSAGAAAAPKLAAALKQATGAGWPARFGPPPTYSKVDAATGWLP